MLSGVLARALLLVAALAAGGWLAVQERAARAEERLTPLAFETPGRLDAGQVREAERLLRIDRRLNPDRRADLFEGLLLAHAGREREGLALVADAAREEPENL